MTRTTDEEHAEAVAAKLVAVICEQDDLIAAATAPSPDPEHALFVSYNRMRAKRDEARAKRRGLEVRLKESARKLAEAREVLAALPERVGALPERADAHDDDCPGRPGYRGLCACEGDILVSRAAVLALIDEAGP